MAEQNIKGSGGGAVLGERPEPRPGPRQITSAAVEQQKVVAVPAEDAERLFESDDEGNKVEVVSFVPMRDERLCRIGTRQFSFFKGKRTVAPKELVPFLREKGIMAPAEE